MTSSLAPLAIVVPLLAGCVLIGVGLWMPRVVRDAVAVGASGVVVALDAALLSAAGGGRVVTWSGGWSPQHGVSVGVALVVDGLGAGIALVAAALVTCALVFSWRYYDDVEAHWQALLLFFLTGMTGFALSGDLFNMVVFFELMGVAAYALTAFQIEDKHAVHGGLNFAVVNSLGAYLALVGLGLVYGRTGQLGLAQLSRALAGHGADVLVVLAFVLVSAGWLVKAAVVPFHFWTADAEAVAPAPICAVLSGAMVELGVYGVARVYWTVFRRALPEDAVKPVLLTLGVVTGLLGALMCITQHNLKRLLAYSTIGHVGLFLTAVAALSPDGLVGAALYVAGHAGVKGSLFLLTGIVLNRYGSVDVRALHGRGRAGDPIAWTFVLAGLALAALPPFGTALGKALSEEALGHEGQWWVTAVFIAVSAATGGAVLRATGRIFFALGDPPEPDRDADEETGEDQGPETEGRLQRVPPSMVAALVVLLGGALAVGVIPGLATAASAAADRFTDPAAFVRQVLGQSAGAMPPPKDLGWTTSGVLLDLLTVATALVVATVSLWWSRVPAALRRTAAAGRPAMGILHRLHSGHLGDYVAWLLLGVAGITLAVWGAVG